MGDNFIRSILAQLPHARSPLLTICAIETLMTPLREFLSSWNKYKMWIFWTFYVCQIRFHFKLFSMLGNVSFFQVTWQIIWDITCHPLWLIWRNHFTVFFCRHPLITQLGKTIKELSIVRNICRRVLREAPEIWTLILWATLAWGTRILTTWSRYWHEPLSLSDTIVG